MAGQIQAQGATIFLRMELLADAENRQPQGTKEGKEDFGSLHSVLGRKSRLVRAETFWELLQNHVLALVPTCPLSLSWDSAMALPSQPAASLCCQLSLGLWPWQVGREINLGWLAEQHLPAELLRTRC